MAVLSDAEVEGRLKSLAGWAREGAEIRGEFKFKDFAEAMIFVNRVAEEAEEADHHPDITINYNRVHLALSTHSEGGLTAKDFDLAAKINAVA
ncbi:MAG: 4a-hydroxytetrahydrobiopterin dehydratase [Dehalococcoidia bacterium]